MAAAGQRTNRVEYLLDPRGIGHSIPSLDCPEVAAAGADLVGLRQRDPARRDTLLSAVRACHDRLTGQGIDPAAYDLTANAQDIEDLRTTLGIASWNLISNGSASRLAFEVARRFPGGLRSVFIDSPSLPDPDFLTIAPAAFDQAIARLVGACAAQPACARSAPDLDEMIREAEGRLDATPIELDVSGTVAAIQLGHPIHVVVDGAALVRWMRGQIGGWGGSQSVLVLRALTSVLDGTLQADSPLASALAAGLTDCIGLLTSCERPNFGALYSIVCSDVAPYVDQASLDATIGGRPAYRDVFAPNPLVAPCDAWPVHESRPAARWIDHGRRADDDHPRDVRPVQCADRGRRSGNRRLGGHLRARDPQSVVQRPRLPRMPGRDPKRVDRCADLASGRHQLPLAHSGDFAGAMKRAGAQHGPSSGRQGLMNDG